MIQKLSDQIHMRSILPVGFLKIGDNNQPNWANQGKKEADYVQLPNVLDICWSSLIVLNLAEAKIRAETGQ